MEERYVITSGKDYIHGERKNKYTVVTLDEIIKSSENIKSLADSFEEFIKGSLEGIYPETFLEYFEKNLENRAVITFRINVELLINERFINSLKNEARELKYDVIKDAILPEICFVSISRDYDDDQYVVGFAKPMDIVNEMRNRGYNVYIYFKRTNFEYNIFQDENGNKLGVSDFYAYPSKVIAPFVRFTILISVFNSNILKNNFYDFDNHKMIYVNEKTNSFVKRRMLVDTPEGNGRDDL